MGMQTTINPNETPNNSGNTIINEPSDNDDNSILDGGDDGLGQEDDLTVDDGEGNEEDPNKQGDEDDAGNDGNDEDEDDNSEVEIPEKFKTKDGQLNLKALSKYIKDSDTNFTQLSQKNSDLEKKQQELQEKANLAETLQKQQDELAKQYGFNDFNAMQERQRQLQADTQMAQFTANCYNEFIALCEDPQGMRDTLLKYSQNPTQELAQTISAEFPADVHFQVGQKVAGFKQQLALYNQQQERARNAKEAEEHINNVVTTYGDYFKNKEFTNFYGLAFQYIGTDLDPEKFFPAMDALKKSWIAEYVAEQKAKKENEDATNDLQNLNPKTNPKQKTNQVDLDKLSGAELSKAISELI